MRPDPVKIEIHLRHILATDTVTMHQYMDEGLPDTAAEMARWIARIGFELHPDLRVGDPCYRNIVKPRGSIIH